MYDKNCKFVLQPLKDHTYLNFGKPYDEFKFYKTVNSLSQIGAWQQVDSRSHISTDTVDFHIFLVPTIKQNFSIDLEASRNTGDFLTSNNLFGLTVNTTYRDRDVWQRAIQSTTTLSNGVELSFEPDVPLLQTIQSSLGHTYTFPRFLPPLNGLDKDNNWDNKRTFFSLNAAYTDRSDFFRLKSFVASTGIQFKVKNFAVQFTPLNIELYSLDTLPLLDTAFITNPFLRTAFNTGSVISGLFSISTTFPDKQHPNVTNYISFGTEWTFWGTLLTDIAKLPDLYQFAKEQAQIVRTYNFRHTQLAMRFVEGVGVNYSGSSRFGITMPFFKQFAEGGPSSMRGWALRQLGLGSSLLSDTASSTFRDRYGDMELEANIEYRFPIATIGGVSINSCFFADAGNVWNVRNDPNNPDGTIALNTLGHDIAIAVGTGIRLDFSYFLIRVDFGLKFKDPARLENDGWLDLSHFTWRNEEFNVKDAVTGEAIPLDNYAFQLGIGLPF
jgi:outer membrane protein assembly factor BamA